ncbi:nucleotide disphospho-sugar-binding domain-containing protein [Embleya sp. NPDC050154]|uniref:glycosyltransferase n=1 Tax=Embleya sp. NPDC050154 TaxID=3363988 RepID=UPI0037ACB09E
MSAEEHRQQVTAKRLAVAGAIENRDGARALELLRAHFRWSADSMIKRTRPGPEHADMALADDDVLVVAVTGRLDGPLLVRRLMGDVPANARPAGFISFEHLLPHTDVLVTNGGYGSVHTAFNHGVPLVVAGSTEDKPEVGARVEWSGTGIDLKTSKPDGSAIRTAVPDVLANPEYAERALRLRKEFSEFDPLGTIAELIARIDPPDPAHPITAPAPGM